MSAEQMALCSEALRALLQVSEIGLSEENEQRLGIAISEIKTIMRGESVAQEGRPKQE